MLAPCHNVHFRSDSLMDSHVFAVSQMESAPGSSMSSGSMGASSVGAGASPLGTSPLGASADAELSSACESDASSVLGSCSAAGTRSSAATSWFMMASLAASLSLLSAASASVGADLRACQCCCTRTAHSNGAHWCTCVREHALGFTARMRVSFKPYST